MSRLTCGCWMFGSISFPSINSCERGCYKGLPLQNCWMGWKNGKAWNVPLSILEWAISSYVWADGEVTVVSFSTIGKGRVLLALAIVATNMVIFDVIVTSKVYYHVFYRNKSMLERGRLMIYEEEIGDRREKFDNLRDTCIHNYSARYIYSITIN